MEAGFVKQVNHQKILKSRCDANKCAKNTDTLAADSALVASTLTAASAMLQQVKGGEVAGCALPGNSDHSPEFTGTLYIK